MHMAYGLSVASDVNKSKYPAFGSLWSGETPAIN